MIIKDIELTDLDILEPDVAEKVENAREQISVDFENALKNDKQSQQLRAECTAVADFIDNLFGTGTADKIFKGRTHLGLYLEVFQNINSEIDELAKKQTTYIEEMTKQYSADRLKR